MLLGELSMMDSNNFPGELNGFARGRHQLMLNEPSHTKRLLQAYVISLFTINFFIADNVGAGEREARIASELVARRHFR